MPEFVPLVDAASTVPTLQSLSQVPCAHGPEIQGPQLKACVSVIVPVYNEVRTIDALLCKVASSDASNDIVVVDDGSTDGTARILQKWRSSPGFRVLSHERNRGKGAAIKTGLAAARNRYVVVQDADLEYDPCDIRSVVSPLIAGDADVVFGSRRLGRGLQCREWLNPFFHGVTLLNWAVFLIYGIRLSDEAACYKAVDANVLRMMELACERFEFCPEVTAKTARMKLRIAEVPVSYAPRTIARGKKIRLYDWFEAVGALWKWRNWNPPPELSAGLWRFDGCCKMPPEGSHFPETAATLSVEKDGERPS